MASLVVEVENLKIEDTKEEERRENFQTIFDVYHSDKGHEKSSLTRLLLSYMENSEDPKTMAAFQTIGTKYKDCFQEALVKAKIRSGPMRH